MILHNGNTVTLPRRRGATEIVARDQDGSEVAFVVHHNHFGQVTDVEVRCGPALRLDFTRRHSSGLVATTRRADRKG